jgi:hypothetical protein
MESIFRENDALALNFKVLIRNGRVAAVDCLYADPRMNTCSLARSVVTLVRDWEYTFQLDTEEAMQYSNWCGNGGCRRPRLSRHRQSAHNACSLAVDGCHRDLLAFCWAMALHLETVLEN